jgi:hypothetical protein
MKKMNQQWSSNRSLINLNNIVDDQTILVMWWNNIHNGTTQKITNTQMNHIGNLYYFKT